ncbi:MAG: hypothetical protein L3J59_10315 [Methylococcaceae bacterium]|nr:hypothetical protein [Methylococcaceae bacterium]
MSNTAVTQNSREKGKSIFFLFSLFLAFVVLIVPDAAHAVAVGASGADQSIKDGVALFVKIITYLTYFLMGVTFLIVAYLLLQSLMQWKDPNSREGTVGGIVGTVFIGLMVMGIIFILGEKGIAYIQEKVVVTDITPITQPAVQVASIQQLPTAIPAIRTVA